MDALPFSNSLIELLDSYAERENLSREAFLKHLFDLYELNQQKSSADAIETIPYDLLFRNLPDFIYVLDLATNVPIYHNRDNFLGYEKQQFLTAGYLLSKIHPDDFNRVLDHWTSIISSPNSPRSSTEYRFQTIDNQWVWIESREDILIDHVKNRSFLVVTLTDITKRKIVEETLKSSEEHYRTVVSTLTEGIVLHNAEGVITTGNKSAERILGLSFEQMSSLATFDERWQAIRRDGSPFPREQHPAIVTHLTGQSQENIIMGVHKPDHSLAWIKVNSTPIFDEFKALPCAVVATFTDITNDFIHDMALKESEERFRIIFETSPVGIALADTNGSILKANPSFCGMLAYTETEILGMNFRDFTTPASLALELPLVEHLIRGEIDHYSLEKQYFTKNKKQILVKLTVSAHRNDLGEPQFFIGIIEDIALRKKAEEDQFAIQLERERNTILNDFIENAAHEFRTPLAIINTNAYLLAVATETDREKKHLIIKQQVKAITNLLDSMLTMLAVSNNNQMDFQPIHVDELVDILETKLRSQSQDRQLDITFNVEDNLPHLYGNLETLVIALGHIMSNAIQFTSDGGSVKLEVSTKNERLLFRVTDSGLGISDADLPHIFERFYRADFAHTDRGFGLGLPVAKSIIETHHGQIDVETVLGQGSVFTIILPCDV